MKIVTIEDLSLVLDKLIEFRKENKIKEYKTLTDSFELMVSNAIKDDINHPNTLQQISELKSKLNKRLLEEINELLRINLQYLKSGKVQEHRANMIALDKLNRVYDKIQSSYPLHK